MAAWIDCTRTVRPGMITWPGDPPPTLTRVHSIAAGDRTNLTALTAGTHVGTHIDAPRHVFEEGDAVDAIPLDPLCGPALVVHVTEPRDVAVPDVADQPIRSGDRVLFRTANEELWGRGRFVRDYYALSVDAARFLVKRHVALVGIDYLSIDHFDASDMPVHRALLSAGVVIVEGLDLSAVEPGRYEMVALPLKLAGADGAPARVILRPSPPTRPIHAAER